MKILKKNNKVAIVTGAGKRIGKAIAIGLGNEGWSVAVHYQKSKKEAEEVVNEIKDNGQFAKSYYANLEDAKECINLIELTAKEMGIVNCLINNASIFERDEIESINSELWDSHIDVNLRAPLMLSYKFAQNITNNLQGNIINLIDQRVWNLTPHFISYSVSKAGLWSLTQILAQALAPKIRVNAIGPGPILPSSRQTIEDFNKQINSTPLGVGASPEEIFDAVNFILNANGMTGQMIALDGGAHLSWNKEENNNE